MCEKEEDLKNWTPRQYPQRIILEGEYVRLEPLNSQKHGDELYKISSLPDIHERFAYLGINPPKNRKDFDLWIQTAETDPLILHFVVIDKNTGKVGGRQALMDINVDHGEIEDGPIYYSPIISRSRVSTEAQYLFMCYIFDTLGYRRLKWKCYAENEASKRSALRLGFKYEGLFRQMRIFNGISHDYLWFSIINKEWPQLKLAYQKWLSIDNFHPQTGLQKKKLGDFINNNMQN